MSPSEGTVSVTTNSAVRRMPPDGRSVYEDSTKMPPIVTVGAAEVSNTGTKISAVKIIESPDEGYKPEVELRVTTSNAGGDDKTVIDEESVVDVTESPMLPATS